MRSSFGFDFFKQHVASFKTPYRYAKCLGAHQLGTVAREFARDYFKVSFYREVIGMLAV